MAKKNLKSALAGHNQRKAIKAHQEKVEAAIARKNDSISGKGQSSKNKNNKRRRVDEDGQSGAGLATEGLSASSAPRRSQSINPFQKDDTILLVGEGDFSYTLSLLLPPHSIPANRILTTSFDSESSCCSKYPTASENIRQIRQLASQAGAPDQEVIRFNVDAGNLSSDKTIKKFSEKSGGFSKIYFGFPHVGQGHKDQTRNVLANQLLILRFFVSAATLLTQGEKPQYALSNEQGVKKRKVQEDDEGQEDEADNVDDQDGDVSEDDNLSDIDPEDDLKKGINSLLHRQSKSQPQNTWPPRSPSRAGSLLVTLRDAKPYTLWSLTSLATRLTSMLPPIASAAPALPKGLKAPTMADIRRSLPEPSVPKAKPKVKGEAQVTPRAKDRGYDTWRSFRFYPSEWKGYKHVRTVGYDERDKDLLLSNTSVDDTTEVENAPDAVCRMWEFGLRT
ncbi:unnamed protein product [Sympodiomycopsis kandeliae]